MTQPDTYDIVIIVWFALAAATFVVLLFITAPYGRHSRAGWGPSIDNRLGWLVMEAPAAVIFVTLFCLGRGNKTATNVVFLILWEAHYLHRAFVYPFSLRRDSKRMPLLLVALALVFNCMNACLIGLHLFSRADYYTNAWLMRPRTILGIALFVLGYAINRHADITLRKLRAKAGSRYRIPQGGLYRWVSCPNYLGEIIEWIGWAIATWSLAGLAFAVWSVANLAPRARSHHKWYTEKFADYPPERTALVPLLW